MSELELGCYRHYKGQFYKVLGVAKHTESGDDLVVYQALYGQYGLWVRPKQMFLESVMINGKCTPRFSFVGEEIHQESMASFVH